MGKIDIPLEIQAEAPTRSVPTQTITDAMETGKKAERAEQAEIMDELNLTNEALRLMSIKKDMGIDMADTNHDKDLRSILEQAKVRGIKNRNQLVARLREIEYKIGHIDDPGQKVKKILEYMRIDNSIRSLVSRQTIMTHGN